MAALKRLAKVGHIAVVWNVLVAPSCGMVNSLLERSLEVRESLGRATESHATADVVAARRAVFAVLTRHTNLERNAISSSNVLDISANSNNGAARLVAKSERLANNDVAVAAMIVVVQVGAAKAGGLDGDLDFVGSGSCNVSIFLNMC